MYHKDKRFRRAARRNEIKRKKKILKHHWCNDDYLNSDKFIEGKLAKGKVHCSCPDCSPKTHNYKYYYGTKKDYTKYSDAKALEKYNAQLEDAIDEEYNLKVYDLNDIIKDISLITGLNTCLRIVKDIGQRYSDRDFYGISAETLCGYDSRLRPYFIGLSGMKDLTKVCIKA